MSPTRITQGLLLDKINDRIQIKTDRVIREILVYGTKYALWVPANWNEHFPLIDATILEKMRDDTINFDFKCG